MIGVTDPPVRLVSIGSSLVLKPGRAGLAATGTATAAAMTATTSNIRIRPPRRRECRFEAMRLDLLPDAVALRLPRADHILLRRVVNERDTGGGWEDKRARRGRRAHDTPAASARQRSADSAARLARSLPGQRTGLGCRHRGRARGTTPSTGDEVQGTQDGGAKYAAEHDHRWIRPPLRSAGR